MLSEVGFEPTPAYVDQNTHNSQQYKQGIILESGALDHSAILTSELLIRYDRILLDHAGINTLLQLLCTTHTEFDIFFFESISSPFEICAVRDFVRFSHMFGRAPTNHDYHAAE